MSEKFNHNNGRHYDIHEVLERRIYHEFETHIPEFEFFDRFYNEPHRYYHNFDHIIDLLNLHSKVSYELDIMSQRERIMVEIAILWHDIVYNPTRTDNEWTSAELFKYIMKMGGSVSEVISNTILDTQHLTPPRQKAPWSLYTLDLDLAGIGSDPLKFADNTKRIRLEFSHVNEAAWCKNRIKFWEALLARGYIYHNPYNLEFFKEAEEQGRKNIAYEQASLQNYLDTV